LVAEAEVAEIEMLGGSTTPLELRKKQLRINFFLQQATSGHVVRQDVTRQLKLRHLEKAAVPSQSPPSPHRPADTPVTLEVLVTTAAAHHPAY
jgi:hypothetical protein